MSISGVSHRMQSGGPDAFDRHDGFAARRACRKQATHDRLAFKQNGARATHPAAADQFAAGQTKILTRDIDEGGIDRIWKASGFAIDCEAMHRLVLAGGTWPAARTSPAS
jgi:hypothetical protein